MVASTPPSGPRYEREGPSLAAGGGAGRDRTGDLRLAKAALSQLSYSPAREMVGLSGFEPLTSRLSAVRSSQLSYRPVDAARQPSAFWILLVAKEQNGRPEAAAGHGSLKTR